MRIDYNKAIRDGIPYIIRTSGKNCFVKTVSDEEFLPYMENKLLEEVNEYLESREIEELADVLEVICRIVELKGVSIDEVKKIQSAKSFERGSFSKNYILISAEDPE